MNDTISPVRVLLVDDDALVRAGLRMILSADTTIDVVGEAANGRDALTEASRVQPDVVLMDIRMPDIDGITATAHLHQLTRAPHVIVLTTFHLDDYVFAALRAGASGFLLKDTAPTDIIHAVHTVAGGEAMLSPAVTRTLIERFTNDHTDSRRTNAVEQLNVLTDRERVTRHRNRTWPPQRRHRHPPLHERSNRQSPRLTPAHQTPSDQPRTSRNRRPRRRPRLTGLAHRRAPSPGVIIPTPTTRPPSSARERRQHRTKRKTSIGSIAPRRTRAQHAHRTLKRALARPSRYIITRPNHDPSDTAAAT